MGTKTPVALFVAGISAVALVGCPQTGMMGELTFLAQVY